MFTPLSDKTLSERSFSDWSMGIRRFTIDEISREKGFVDIKGIDDLSKLAGKSGELLYLMRAIYQFS